MIYWLFRLCSLLDLLGSEIRKRAMDWSYQVWEYSLHQTINLETYSMKNVCVPLISILLILATSFSASASKVTGNDLLEYLNNDLDISKGYVMGFARGVDYESIFSGELVCIPDNVPNKQFILIIKKYLNDNPEILHEPADILIYSALMDAFSCDKVK